MLREQYERLRASEAEARTATSEARQAVRAALYSRDRLAARIVDAADRAGPHAGAILQIARDPLVVKWARRQDEDDTSFHRSSTP
jgi:hypothetical protein